MSDRRKIGREEILRSEPGLSDLRAAMSLLREEVPGFRRAAAILVALVVAEVAAQLAVAIATKELLDAATGPEAEFAPAPALAGVGFALLSFLALRSRQAFQEQLALDSRSAAVGRVAGHIQRASYEDLAAVPMAELREIVMTDIEFAYRFAVETAAQVVAIGVWTVAAVALVAVLSPPVLLTLVVVAVIFALALARGTKRHLALTGRRFLTLSDLSQKARDLVEVERVLVARQFGLEERMERRFSDAHRAFVEVALEQGRLAAEVRSGILTLNSVAFLGVVATGGALIASGSLQAGGLIAILFVVGQLLASVAQVSDSAHRAAETAAAGRRLSAYWHPDDHAPAPAPAERIERVDLHSVSFGYRPEVPVVEGLDLTLSRGVITGMTAEIGAGKTTVALLAAGLLRPRAGDVLIDGVADAAPSALAGGRILYVGAKPILFEGSVVDNLLLGPGADPDDHRWVLEALGLDGTRLDPGAQLIGPDGLGVSSGQGQLIQLARAVSREPEVIILDEATGALDQPTEAEVQSRLVDWCRRRVCLVISHRSCPWLEAAEQRLSLEPGGAGFRAEQTVG